ncbi:MAG: pirin family protein [Bacteroidetes bacterium]|nr:pirin family protein [Bacteroidota bacterium]
MDTIRSIKSVFTNKPVIEGAGVHLRRVFGYHETPQFDPFLLLDDFHSSEPEKYIQGFPWHPHRGIETITYVIKGTVEHGDSMGNSGTIQSGDVQWMTAGNGIIHQEMPDGDEQGLLWGLQLWANLPASHKMMPPRYQEIVSSDIPVHSNAEGSEIRVIAGEYLGHKGPVTDIMIEPEYFDISLSTNRDFVHTVPLYHTCFIYILEGEITLGTKTDTIYTTGQVLLLNYGETVQAAAKEKGARCVFASGKPLGESIAWRGPIVMNTQEEIRKAFSDLDHGTFIKNNKNQNLS